MPNMPKKELHIGSAGMPEQQRKVCLIPNCGKTAAANVERGLCLGCYSHAKKWDRLVGLGLALSIADTDPFTAAFNARDK